MELDLDTFGGGSGGLNPALDMVLIKASLAQHHALEDVIAETIAMTLERQERELRMLRAQAQVIAEAHAKGHNLFMRLPEL